MGFFDDIKEYLKNDNNNILYNVKELDGKVISISKNCDEFDILHDITSYIDNKINIVKSSIEILDNIFQDFEFNEKSLNEISSAFNDLKNQFDSLLNNNFAIDDAKKMLVCYLSNELITLVLNSLTEDNIKLINDFIEIKQNLENLLDDDRLLENLFSELRVRNSQELLTTKAYNFLVVTNEIQNINNILAPYNIEITNASYTQEINGVLYLSLNDLDFEKISKFGLVYQNFRAIKDTIYQLLQDIQIPLFNDDDVNEFFHTLEKTDIFEIVLNGGLGVYLKELFSRTFFISKGYKGGYIYQSKNYFYPRNFDLLYNDIKQTYINLFTHTNINGIITEIKNGLQNGTLEDTTDIKALFYNLNNFQADIKHIPNMFKKMWVTYFMFGYIDKIYINKLWEHSQDDDGNDIIVTIKDSGGNDAIAGITKRDAYHNDLFSYYNKVYFEQFENLNSEDKELNDFIYHLANNNLANDGNFTQFSTGIKTEWDSFKSEYLDKQDEAFINFQSDQRNIGHSFLFVEFEDVGTVTTDLLVYRRNNGEYVEVYYYETMNTTNLKNHIIFLNTYIKFREFELKINDDGSLFVNDLGYTSFGSVNKIVDEFLEAKFDFDIVSDLDYLTDDYNKKIEPFSDLVSWFENIFK
jgi:hypothetical protein